MAWTAPRTWVSGETVTAAQLNTHLRDNMLETAPAKVTTAGDIVYATGANALARLAPGTKFKQLQMNSGATAPQWGAAVQHVMKTADESVSSSTSIQDDNELLFAVGTNEKWIFEIFLYVGTSVTANMDIAFSVPASASGIYGGVVDQTPSVLTRQGLTTENTVGLASGAETIAFVWGFVATAGTSGNVTLRWAQSSSSVNAVTLKAGSMLRATRVV